MTHEPAVVLGRQERERRGGHDVGDRRELLRRGLRLGDEARRSRRRSRGGTASRRRSCRPRGGGTSGAWRRRSSRRRRGSPRTGPGGARRRRAGAGRPPSRPRRRAGRRSSCPCLRTRKPMPPLSVMPPIPTVPASPNPVARPCAPAAVVYSPAVRPVSAQAVRARASISRPRRAERSSTIPPSETPWPAGLWPPLRTASSVPVSRASVMTRETSSASAARTIMAGRRSIAPMKTLRAWS